MSTITLLGSARRTGTGPTRRETLKVAALSLLGGLFQTPALLALEGSPLRYRRPVRAKSVVLIYLQGGPPTQDMFDLKPDAPEGIRSEFKPIATSARASQVCELLPLTAQWMHKTAVVRSVYHNGGCHKNLPMYTGFDVNLPDEEFRDTDPPSMGSVCAYLERDRQRALPPYVYLPCSLGWGEARRRRVRTAGSWAGGMIRSAPSVRRSSIIRRMTSGGRRSCGASRTWAIRACPTRSRSIGCRTAGGWSISSTSSSSGSSATTAWATIPSISAWRSRCLPRRGCGKPST